MRWGNAYNGCWMWFTVDGYVVDVVVSGGWKLIVLFVNAGCDCWMWLTVDGNAVEIF